MTRRLSFLMGVLAALCVALLLPPDTLLPGASADVTCSTVPMTCSAGGTFTGGTITTPILAPDGTSLAPSYSFSSDSALGMYYYGASTVGFAKSGSVFFRAATTGMVFNDNATLVGESAHVLALRSSTNAQTFNWYYSYTDASNYHRGALKTSASGIEIAAETAGSGADNLDITLTPAGTGKVVVGGTASPAATDACTQWSVTVDANYIYVCTATGVWKRAALTGGY